MQVNFDKGYSLGQADYGKFVEVDRGDLETFGYPVSGYGKYAILTYGVNDSGAVVPPLGPVTNLDEVEEIGFGASVDVSAYHNFTVHIISTNVTTGASVAVQHSLNGTDWHTFPQDPITENKVTEVFISFQAYRYLRTNVIDYTDGTFTTLIYANN